MPIPEKYQGLWSGTITDTKLTAPYIGIIKLEGDKGTSKYEKVKHGLTQVVTGVLSNPVIGNNHIVLTENTDEATSANRGLLTIRLLPNGQQVEYEWRAGKNATNQICRRSTMARHAPPPIHSLAASSIRRKIARRLRISTRKVLGFIVTTALASVVAFLLGGGWPILSINADTHPSTFIITNNAHFPIYDVKRYWEFKTIQVKVGSKAAFLKSYSHSDDPDDPSKWAQIGPGYPEIPSLAPGQPFPTTLTIDGHDPVSITAGDIAITVTFRPLNEHMPTESITNRFRAYTDDLGVVYWRPEAPNEHVPPRVSRENNNPS